jgi:sec-independent protein translocase protein TatB
MLPEIGAAELIVIAAVALIVVGPKDLPLLLRKVGKFMAKMRGLAAEFRNSFDEMARQSELDELRREVEALRSGAYVHPVAAELNESFQTIDADLRSVDAGSAEAPATPHEEPIGPATEDTVDRPLEAAGEAPR